MGGRGEGGGALCTMVLSGMGQHCERLSNVRRVGQTDGTETEKKITSELNLNLN